MPDDPTNNKSPFAVPDEAAAPLKTETPVARLDIPETFPPPPIERLNKPSAESSVKIPEIKPIAPGAAAPEQTPQISTVLTKGSSSKFGFFAILGVVIGLLVWGAVAYLYITNKNLEGGTGKVSQNNPPQPTVLPTPSFSADQIKILNGSIIRAVPGSDPVTLVDKREYKTTGITGFAKVVVSPDNSKMCFEAWPPAPAPALYFSSIEGTNVVKIGENYKNCLWSPDSSGIFYIKTGAEGYLVDIYAYDTNRGQEKNITTESQQDVEKAYEIVGLSGDGLKVICKYKILEGSLKDSEKGCEVNISGLTVKDTD